VGDRFYDPQLRGLDWAEIRERYISGCKAAIIRQMLDPVRRSGRAEPSLNRRQHHVTHIGAADAGSADGTPGDDLAVKRRR